jgi:two-component system CheB/CheR fusion protein
MRMLPYRTSQNVIDGVVITLVDIDRVKRAEGLAASRVFAQTIVETVREPLLVLDSNLLVSKANRSFFRVFRLEGNEVEKRSVFEIGGGILGFSRLREVLREIVEKGHAFQDLELVHDFPVVGRRRMLLNARKMEGEAAGAGHILLALDDVTNRPEA